MRRASAVVRSRSRYTNITGIPRAGSGQIDAVAGAQLWREVDIAAAVTSGRGARLESGEVALDVAADAVQGVGGVSGQAAARARGQRVADVADRGDALAGDEARAGFGDGLAAGAAGQRLERSPQAALGVRPESGHASERATGGTAGSRQSQRRDVEAGFPPPSLDLVYLGAVLDGRLLGALAHRVLDGHSTELFEIGLGERLRGALHRILGHRLKGPGEHPLEQFPEDPRNRPPARGDHRRSGRCGGTQGREGGADQESQFEEHEPELDVHFDLGALDIATGLVDQVADLVEDHREVPQPGLRIRGVVAPDLVDQITELGLGSTPAGHNGRSTTDDRVDRHSQVMPGGVPVVGLVPDQLLVALGPLDADRPLQRLDQEIRCVRPPRQWMRDR